MCQPVQIRLFFLLTMIGVVKPCFDCDEYKTSDSGVFTEEYYIFEPGSDFDVSIRTENITHDQCSMDKLSLVLQLCNGTNWTLNDPSPLYSLKTNCTDNTTMTTHLTFYNISDKLNESRIIINRMSELLPDKCFLLLMKPVNEDKTGPTPTMSDDSSSPANFTAIIIIVPVIFVVFIIPAILIRKRRKPKKCTIPRTENQKAGGQLNEQPAEKNLVPGVDTKGPLLRTDSGTR